MFLAAALAALQLTALAEPTPAPTADARIEYYTRKIAADPKLYPVYVQLGSAYLEKARETHDPGMLPKAEAAFRKSIEIQPNLPAFGAMSALCNYRHRFDEAIQWGRGVLETEPNDSAVIAGMIEAYLALGQEGDAEKLLAGRRDGTGDFHLAAAHGVLLKAQGKATRAAEAFARAADAAKAQKAGDLAAWGFVQIAGVWIDSGDVERAIPFLEQAATLDAGNTELKIHQAEVVEARGQISEALRYYEELLAKGGDPFIHAKACELSRTLGDTQRARQHFDAAERGFKKAIDANEVYTLGALARLYRDAGVRLDEALKLAKRNAEHQRDAASRQLIESIERATTPKPP